MKNLARAPATGNKFQVVRDTFQKILSYLDLWSVVGVLGVLLVLGVAPEVVLDLITSHLRPGVTSFEGKASFAWNEKQSQD